METYYDSGAHDSSCGKVRSMKARLLFLAVCCLLLTGAFSCASSQNVATTSTAPPGVQPAIGGTLRILTGSEPAMLGYQPLMGPEDIGRVNPGIEPLMIPTIDRKLEPLLAESVVEDAANRRITFYLRPDVKFHDGSSLDADAVIWNFQIMLDAGRLTYSEYLESIQKIDDLTVQLNLKEYNNQLLLIWGRLSIFSQHAWEEASGGDTARGIDWARHHCVGTGPFVLEKSVTDVSLTWRRNPDYWQEGKPYLDGIEVEFIPSNPTSRLKMLAGEADFWEFSYSLELEEHGFDVWQSWNGVNLSIWPNTAGPGSRWNDIRLRQALECAIDKKTITDTFGPDTFKPLDMILQPGEWGYDASYPFRTFDPEKARQLVAQAGYPDGLDAELLLGTAYGGQPLGEMVQAYLAAVGIRVDLDLAEPGRFFAAIYQNPGPDLVITYSGVDLNSLNAYFDWFSTDSLAGIAYLGHDESEKEMERQAVLAQSEEAQRAAAMDLYRRFTDDVKIIPLMWFGLRDIVAPYVHGPYPVLAAWHTEDLWMDEH